MDNLLLEALLESTGAQLAFSNGWRFGAPIVPGAVTLNDLYNMVPMDPPVSTVELSGEEVRQMLEENLEQTFSGQALHQMGGYVKRALGLKAVFRVQNPQGERLQQLFVGDREIEPHRYYTAAFVTEQAVPTGFGRNRQQTGETAVTAMRNYLSAHDPVRIDLKGTFLPA